MELSKRKYKKVEVKSLLDEALLSYDEKEKLLTNKIKELQAENKALEAQIMLWEDKKEEIIRSVENVARYETTKKAELDSKYKAAAETIKSFLRQWKEYFDLLSQKYPMYPVVQKTADLKQKIETIINGGKSDKEIFECASDFIKNDKTHKKPFDPQKKINDYIAATSENGFNLDEVLNPGELELEDLCKELGLIEENI